MKATNIIIVIMLIISIVLYVNLSKAKKDFNNANLTNIELMQNNLALETEIDKMSEDFEVEKITECRKFTADVLETDAYLKRLQERKNAICDEIINKPIDIIDPRAHYKVEYNEDSWQFTVVAKENEVSNDDNYSILER